MGKDGQFYLGKFFNLKKNEISNDRLTYNPPDLTTHAIITGMTGSGASVDADNAALSSARLIEPFKARLD